MEKTILSVIVISFLFPLTLTAQVTGFVEDFNDNILTGWEVPGEHQRTYTLAETTGALKIDYHRIAASWEWDNFNFTPPLIDASNNPFISIKVRSTIKTELALKPVHGSATSDWLKVQLPADDTWHLYTFELTKADSGAITRIYMYLDGGSTTPASGLVYFDDLKIGDKADVTELLDAIEAARELYNNSVEGINEGEFLAGSKALLKIAIDAAQAVHGSPTRTFDDVKIAVWNLYDACVSFETKAIVNNINIIDDQATKETKYLFYNLQSLAKTNLLFGMRDPTGYGVGWSGDDDRSDVKDVCGSYPAISAWGIRDVALGNDVSRDRYRTTSAFARGGINTVEWHQMDPKGRGFYAADVNYEKIVRTILPGGEFHDLYIEKLRRIASYWKSLRGIQGHSIPIIFRPYHEHTGNWFWWGKDHCTREEFIQLWQFTVSYVRDSLNVHNMLVAYSPGSFANKAEYLDRYPGDDFVDILGFDTYFQGSITQNTINTFVRQTREAVELAEARQKIAAITETGRESLDIHDWFTRIILNPIKNDSVAKNISYLAVWRNANTTHHFAPYPGHPSVPDFLKFVEDPYIMLEDDLPDVYALMTLDSIPPYFKQVPPQHFVSFDTNVVIEMVTNERAFLRYSPVDQPYSQMPFEFEEGQGNTRHAATIHGKHGQDYVYYVRAIDQYGNAMDSSAVVSFKIDVSSAPRYWKDIEYDITSWKSGIAPFGFGSGDVKTTINNVRTAYFRHEFNLEDASSITYFSMIVKYDNGFAVYLNGKEASRINLSFGELSYDNWAIDASGGFKALTLDVTQLGLLRSGKNMIAVELHQNEGDQADMLFDLRALNPDPIIEFGSNWHYFQEGREPEVQTGSTGVKISDHTLPDKFVLYQNYPNPFNPKTRVRYQLAQSGQVELSVYNLLGERIAALVNERQNPGNYVIQFDASDLASGIYFYQLKTERFNQVKKMLVIR